MSDALRIANLTVAFDGHRALDDVGITIARGESFGLVGESGSGKSTLLRAVVGLTHVTAGSVALDGEAFADHRRPPGFYRKVQMVFQDPYGSLHPRQTVDRLLAEPLRIHGIGDAEARIRRALDEVGLGPSFRFRYPHQMSGGQRQRVAIARALILEPEMLLLDEPTSALDASVQAEVLNLLEQVRRERGLTFLMVSHDLGIVAHLCGRLVTMRRGRIVEALAASALASGNAADAYTRALIAASRGFVRRG